MKRIILLITFLLSLGTSFAALDNAAVYYSFDNSTLDGNNPRDISGNNPNAFNNGTSTGIVGIVGESFSFDGISNYVSFNGSLTNNINFTGSDYSINYWVKTTSSAGQLFAAVQGGGSFNFWDISGGLARQRLDDGPNQLFTQSTTSVDDDNWYFVTHTWNSSNKTARIFVDSVLEDATTNAAYAQTTLNYEPVMGARNNSGIIDSFNSFEFDEFSLYTRILNQTEINTLYNNGSGFNPYGLGAQITFNNPIQGQYLNSTSIPLNITFSTITNSTYILNAGNETTLCTNCNESSNVTLTGVEGLNNLTILTNTSGQLTNSSISFTIDTIVPTINDSIPVEINDYSFNGSWFSCSDTNIDSCNVSINGFNQVSGTNFNLTNNGNLSYTITAIDLVGNTATANGVLFVNPTIYFSFNDSGTLVENYTFGGRQDVSGLVSYNIYNDGLGIGNHSLEFNKLGYILQNFTFEFTNTTNINYTFNVNQAIINVNIYDRDTETLITDNVSLQLIGPIGDTTSTVTGQATLQAINGSAGDYQIIASSTNYETESVYFTYNNQENLSVDIYMLNTTDLDLGYVTIEVKDTLSFFIEGAIVNLLEWKPAQSAYVSVAECQTVSNGKCDLNIELNNKLYKFQATKNGDTKTTASQIITTTGTLVPITLEDIVLTETPNSDNIVATFTESINNLTNISTARLQWNLLDGANGRACITVYSNPGYSQSVLAQNCTTSSSGILFLATAINNSFNIAIVGTVADSFNTYTIDSFSHEGTASLAAALQEYNLDVIVPLILLFLGFGIGIFFGNIYIALSLGLVLEWIATIIAPRVMSVSMAVVITAISGLIVWGLSKK